MGSQPDWYPFIRAAKYLGVAPWELMQQSVHWVRWANDAEAAEVIAEREQTNRASRRAKTGGKGRRR